MSFVASPPEPRTQRYAGLATRTLAFAVDAAVINAVAWFVGAVVALGLSLLGVPDNVRTVIAVIGAAVALAWTVGYFVFFWSASGQTLGNRVLGIAVVDAVTGAPIHAGRAALRVFGLLLSALLLCTGFLLILVDARRRALHDRLVRTVVVFTPTRRPASSRRPARHDAEHELRAARREQEHAVNGRERADGHVGPDQQHDAGRESEHAAHD